ncbi:hypothetical protein JCM19275_2130 [Nonlabens ulvanivorans]|uniref:Uncharacterized protein n=1 Tax=Nonlabens ulvanivorans TaxID=906888 RepID=A0A090WN05_NONUL|nr:hypothetical protein [Nonlabens ulvanivorans]GAL76794.1 hypothetical protein JCM19275_2130 [Nonlabens ulvanivorans]
MSDIKNIWIGSEEKGTIQDGTSETNDNSDVIVTFENGERYIATFFTYQNIDWLRQKNQKTGECLNGKYFFATDLILIDKLNREEIINVVNHLIKEDDFFTSFDKIKE